jgi:hypothetical protein
MVPPPSYLARPREEFRSDDNATGAMRWVTELHAGTD